jgi:hypothetical protein
VSSQKVEFEERVTNNIGYITGSLTISGKATDVIQAILSLEAKSPAVFLDKLNMNNGGRPEKGNLLAQIYIGYWFTRNKAITP